ncbi:Haloacid Dehalogenase Superfamily Class (subfamily) IIA [Williamsia serinedens]|uniref:Haloacid Dehalogenase Superfamily Class (Subfamily) IIA n=1 Tax=Williamsia serinedens TaxID=391736 RepID=A0ABT1GX18_9NOCA|nr:HAD-IIA family hydrolase [Williamsia serinedens]MCP2159542.1 Haloacid Dehalogenase Superfamily Class (subfamily) IIA [Williamsia serinedens]
MRRDEPALPDDVTPQDLDGEVRRDLKTLDRTNADAVARHLVMVSRLLEDDPAAALLHARAARGRAGRIAVVRETAGIAAYNAGEWSEALSELRAARRMSGSTVLLPLMADCERGLGHPERAIDIARSEEGRALTGDEALEMRIVESGARLDLGDPEKAVVTLQSENLDPAQHGTGQARLFYAYATALHAAGREDDAVTWFMNAAAADEDDVTDAELRLMEITDPEQFAAVYGDDSVDAGDVAPVDDIAAPADVEIAPAPPTRPEDVSVDDADDPVAVPAADTPDVVETADVVESPDAAPTETPDVPAETPAAPVETEAATGDTPAVSESALVAGYDAVFADLDGTLFAGSAPVDHAVATVEALTVPIYFVTNNASRRPAEVAAHLEDLGFRADAERVVTSAQTAARLLAEHVEPGSRALVVGTDGLVQEVREVGIATTRSADDRPVAVIQGHNPETGWAQLSEAALAIRAGALWIACNTDATLPSERGLLVGNGSMVAAVASATGATPIVAGKPAAPHMQDVLTRSGASRPIVVGDRLDTDIAGANAVGLDSLLVLTGVSSLADAICAVADSRPTHVAADLTGLLADADLAAVGADDCWDVRVDGTTIRVAAGEGADEAAFPGAVLAAAWADDAFVDVAAADLTVVTDDDTAAAAARRYGLSSDSVERS